MPNKKYCNCVAQKGKFMGLADDCVSRPPKTGRCQSNKETRQVCSVLYNNSSM